LTSPGQPTPPARERPPRPRLRRLKARPNATSVSLWYQNGGFDVAELGLEDVLNGLHLDAMPAHLELRVDSAEEVHALCLDVDFAFVPGAVEAAELRVRYELLGG
jgi:hypothetical protein